MSDRRRHDEDPAGISDHKRMLAISADKRAREEGGGEGTKYVDKKVWNGGKRVIAGKVQMCFIMIGH